MLTHILFFVSWAFNVAWSGIVNAPVQSVVSLAALIFSLVSFVEARQRGLATARFSQTMSLLDEWRRDLVPARQHINSISKKLSRDVSSWDLGYGKQSIEDRAAIERVSHSFDYAGWLLVTGNIDQKIFLTCIGPPVIRHWLMLRNCLDVEREFRRTETEGESGIENEPLAIGGKPPGLYQAGFEHLAQVAYEQYAHNYINVRDASFEVPGYPVRRFRH